MVGGVGGDGGGWGFASWERSTKHCFCHKICTSRSTKYCTCHEACTSTLKLFCSYLFHFTGLYLLAISCGHSSGPFLKLRPEKCETFSMVHGHKPTRGIRDNESHTDCGHLWSLARSVTCSLLQSRKWLLFESKPHILRAQ